MDLQHFLRKVRDWIHTKRGYSILGVVLGLFLLLLLVRSCAEIVTSPNQRFLIARDTRWDSLNLMGKEKSLNAFIDDLSSEISNEEKIRLTIAPESATLTDHLIAGEVDGIFASMAPDVMLQRTYLFSAPFLLTGPVLVVPVDSKFNTLDQAKYKIIGVQPQTSTIFEMRQNTDIQFRLYENTLKELADLEHNQIDGVVLDLIPAYYYTTTFYKGKLRVATGPLTNDGLRLITLKTAKGEELIKMFNEGLQKVKASGEYDKLLLEWGLINPEKIEEP